MLEWWQALIIGVAPAFIGGVIGGGVGLLTAYFVQRWTQQGTIGAEVRQARSDERRKAVAPISQFLDNAARVDAATAVKLTIRRAYDGNVADMQKFGTYERIENMMLRDVEKPPDMFALTNALYLTFSAAPTREWFLPLLEVWLPIVNKETGEGSADSMRSAIQTVRKMVEDYIVEG